MIKTVDLLQDNETTIIRLVELKKIVERDQILETY